jgi:hypothetical protein
MQSHSEIKKKPAALPYYESAFAFLNAFGLKLVLRLTGVINRLDWF